MAAPQGPLLSIVVSEKLRGLMIDNRPLDHLNVIYPYQIVIMKLSVFCNMWGIALIFRYHYSPDWVWQGGHQAGLVNTASITCMQ